MARLVLSLLGTFQVASDERPITSFESVKVRALLAYLASESSRPHRRESLATLLWPDWPPQSATNNLRYSLADLRKNIGDRAADPPYLLINRERIQLNREANVWVDVTEFESATQGSSITQLRQSAIDLYRGPFLEGFSLRDSAPFEDWLLAKREYLSQQMLKALSRLAEACIDQRDYEQAEAYARRQIEMEPWREKAYHQLMRTLSLRGERIQALALFEDLRKALQRELKVEPSEETIQLYQQIRDGKVEIRNETVVKEIAQVVKTPILVLSEKPRHNLPKLLTTFIGREQEQKEVMQLAKQNRLVTITGSGGIGKTRLSQQVGHKLLNEYPDGVWFIALDSLSDPALVPQTVASVFDIRESQNEPVIKILKDVLRQKTALLLLDNCEHLADACAQLITALLMNCPKLAILATSRETLNVAGEAIYSMPSLSLPEQEVSLAELSKYESIKLFAERAALAVSSFTLTKENIHTVADICRRVDGIPLAIELAAARVHILSVEEILKQLQDSFSLLTSGDRIVIERHQTLRASMDWSWGLLSEAEQIFLRQLSVFAGGWTLDAAQAVCDGDVLSLTGTLVNKSLIAVNQEAGRETRYRFHEIVRQYSREKLIESGDSELVRDRYLAYFVKLAERAEPELYRSDQVRWLNRLWDELDNLRMAMEWALATDSESGLRLIVSPWLFWDVRGDVRELESWLAQLLEQYRGVDALRARALAIYSQLIFYREDFAKACVIAEQSLEVSRAISDQQAEAFSLWGLGFVQVNLGKAKPFLEQSLALYRSLGDKFGQAEAMREIGEALASNNPFDNDLLLESLRLYRELGHLSAIAYCLHRLAHMASRDGDFSSAAQWLEEARTLYRQLGSQLGEGYVLQVYGLLSYFQGDFNQAYTYFEEAIMLARAYGRLPSWVHACLAYAVLRQGDPLRAKKIFGLCIQLFQNNMNGLAFTIEGLASLHVEQKQSERAARLFGWVDATREQINYPRPPVEQASVERDLAWIHSQISDTAFEKAYESGKIMTLEEAVAFVLADADPQPGTPSLYKQIRDGKVEARKETAIAVEIPTPALSEKPGHNLPVQRTALVGRQAQIAQVKALFDQHRLVTLIGSGGVGKTRLSLRIAEELLEQFPDGVWLAELASVTDPALIPQTVATVLGLQARGSQSISDILLENLQDQQALLVLDNCEHLIEACAMLVDRVLSACSQIKILATSREALGVVGEMPFRVPSLSLPDSRQASDLEYLEQCEAVRMFSERARIARPDFQVTDDNAVAVAQICQRLDGIPLAIELAASRLNVLTTDQLAQRLDNIFRLLAGGARTALARHQTLRATIDWSYQLLSEPERALLRRLSVFVGSFDLPALEAVCMLDEIDKSEEVEVLASLVNKSMLLAERQSGLGMRYHLLETVQQYAREKLDDSGETSQLQDRHAAFYLDGAEKYEAILYDPHSVDWLRQIDADLANIRVSLTWVLEGPMPEKGSRAAQALKVYWIMRGLLGEGRAWLEKALSRVDQTRSSLSLTRLLLCLGEIIHHSASDDEKAIEYIAQARVMFQDLGDRLGYGRATQVLADISMRKEEYYAESVAIFKELGAEGDLASALWTWGGFRNDCHDFEGARALLEDAERLFRKLGSWNIGAVQATLAVTFWQLGKPERARDLFQQGLATLRAVDNQWGLLILLASQAEMEMELASDSAGLHRAEVILLEELEIARKFGSNSTFFAYISALLGNVAQKQSRYSLAVERFRESLLIVHELGSRSWHNTPSIIGRCLLGLAEAEASLEQAVFSAQLLGAMQRLGASVEVFSAHDLWGWITPADFERVTAMVRSQLDEAAVQSAWNAGQAMTLEEAVAFALNDLQ